MHMWEKLVYSTYERQFNLMGQIGDIVKGSESVEPGLLQKLGPNMSIKQVPSPLGQNQIIIPTNDSK